MKEPFLSVSKRVAAGQTTLADKISGLEERDDRFLTLRRHDRDFDPAFSNVEDRAESADLA